MTTHTALPRILVALHRPRSVPAFISLARAIVQSMTGRGTVEIRNDKLAALVDVLQELRGCGPGAEPVRPGKTAGAAVTA